MLSKTQYRQATDNWNFSNLKIGLEVFLNFFACVYFKDEAMKFPPNHPQRSYVKTAEATGLPQRTISWICKSPKSSMARSSAAAKNSQSVTTPPELTTSTTAAPIPVPDKTSPPATRKVHPRVIIVDDFDRYVIRRKIAEDGFKTITAERSRPVCEYVKKVEAEYLARDNLCESEAEKLVINLAEDSSSEED